MSNDVLDRVALAVNSSLELGDVLDRLVNLALEAVPADRCCIFLLDETGRRLVPASYAAGGALAAALEQPENQERRHFRDMPPIELEENPIRWEAFSRGRAVAISDLRSSPLVPPEVVSDYGAKSAVVVPLLAPDQALGVLSLDWTSPVSDIGEAELVMTESVGAYAALAIRNARLYQKLQDKTRSLEGLVDVASQLSSSMALREVLETACRSFRELLGSPHCSVNAVDPDHPTGYSTVAAVGDDQAHTSSLSPADVADVFRRWAKSPDPVHIPPSQAHPRSSVMLFPVPGAEGVKIFLVASHPAEGRPAEDVIEVGRALTGLLASAMDRTKLYESLRDQLSRMESLSRLSEVVAGTTDLHDALEALNRLLGSEAGVELSSISIANERLRTVLGGPALTPADLETIKSWRAQLASRRGRPGPVESEGEVLVPIVHRRRVQGILRAVVAGAGLGEEARSLLEAVGTACAEILHKTALRRELAESERRLAIAAERDRIAAELHESVGQLVTGLGLSLRAYASEAPDEKWRSRLEDLVDVTAKGSRQIRDSINALLFFQARGKDLVGSLEDLARTFRETSGIEAGFELRGRASALQAEKEDALFRVAHEALTNVQRHSRATSVTVTLTYGTDEVSLAVRDEGRGLGGRDPLENETGHFGLRGLHRRMQEVGGELLVADAHPRGTLVEARIRLRRRRGDGLDSDRGR